MQEPSLPKCIHEGCKRRFDPATNTSTSCKYHTGKPIFHDLKKGWTCCNKIVYDWDEFQAIIPCVTGSHLSEEESSKKEPEGQSSFFQSSTVQNAKNALEKANNSIVIKNIDDFNKEEAVKKEISPPAQKEKKLFISDKGLCKCINKGCGKEFDEKENNEGVCEYHAGEPVFHDLKKYWTCCKKESYDWDEFMQIPKCCKGRHNPKYL